MAEPALYERLGGTRDRGRNGPLQRPTTEERLKNAKPVDANPELKEWHTVTFAGRLPGLKFLRTQWVALLAGGPFQYTDRELRDAHFDLKIPPGSVRRGRCGAWPYPRSLRRSRVSEGGSLSRLRRMEG
jgi:hemoglobin